MMRMRAVSKVVDVAPLPSFDKNPEIVIGAVLISAVLTGSTIPI